MRWLPTSSAIASLFIGLGIVAACGGDDGGPPAIDATPLLAAEVACTGVLSPVITTAGFAFSPVTTTVTVGTVVKFTVPLEHNAMSDDGLFSADFNGDTCVRFDAPGTYRFFCVPHVFRGTVLVN